MATRSHLTLTLKAIIKRRRPIIVEQWIYSNRSTFNKKSLFQLRELMKMHPRVSAGGRSALPEHLFSNQDTYEYIS
jgi:hypothetical protein